MSRAAERIHVDEVDLFHPRLHGTIGGGEGGTGMEIFTRSSMYSIRNPSQVSIFLRETLTQEIDDRNWSWKFLRGQFNTKGLEELYCLYQRRLQHAYFCVFLILQVICSTAQFIVLLSAAEDIALVIPDIVCAALMCVFCVPLMILACNECLFHGSKWRRIILSAMFLLILLATDLTPPLVHLLHTSDADITYHMRPLYGTHAMLACFVFLPLPSDAFAIGFGFIVLAVHVTAHITISQVHNEKFVYMVAGEGVFLLTVSGIGLFFRFVSEVVLRRTFLDRRACVESTCKLNYEKEQEEQLMLSILPRHIANQVMDDIRSTIQQLQNYQRAPLRKKPFSQLYAEWHDNVSILYADVVEFAKLTVTLPVNKLVETLNELFGRFDEASEVHNVLRIKFLGDCYYSVAGVPTPNPQHAKSCVELGLDMIAIIREVREERRLKVDMRIGIHSGKILSGLLGVCKWQYDIWSRDVIIANHMEQTGRAGRVHITKQTRNLLGNAYEYEPGYGEVKDPLLAKYKIETFLICPSDKQQLSERTFVRQQHGRRTSEMLNRIQGQYQTGSLLVPRPSHVRQMRRSTGNTSFDNGSGNASPARRRTVFMDNNLYVYQQMLKMTDKHMENAINRMPLRKVDQWFNTEKTEDKIDTTGEEAGAGARRISRIHPIFLKFENYKWEIPFLKQPDPLFKFYLTSSLFVMLCMIVLHFLVMNSAPTVSWVIYSVSLLLLLFLSSSSWTAYIWKRREDPHNENERIESPKNTIILSLYTWAQNITSSVVARFMLYLMVYFALSLSALSNLLVECEATTNGRYVTFLLSSNNSESHHLCSIPWHVTEAFSLALLSTIVFLRVHFLLKLVCTFMFVGFYTWTVWSANGVLYIDKGATSPGLDPRISHTMHIWFLAICVHLIDRQVDYMNRLDYCWKRQLLAEQEEAANTRTVNKMLLQNILPVHVAEVYLNMNRAHDELFHEEYEAVAVVFASLVGYSLHDDEGDEEDGLNDDGMAGLTLLNEIITDFDKLLFEKQFERVEKIKVAGYTYMAACGLQPGRRDSNASSYASSSASRGETVDEPPCVDNIVVLIKFAAHMMAVLKAFNKDALQTFSPLKLRVGICHGHVMAGVVGEKKPLYDIWGDTVNMASRMDSTGEAGKIQIMESTARLLESQGIKCERRGMTNVKGKGEVLTYFVPIDENFRLLSNKLCANLHNGTGSAASSYGGSDHETSL